MCALSFLPFHSSVLSSLPSLSLSRGTLHAAPLGARSARARRPLGALSHSSVLLPGLLFRCPVAHCSAAQRPLGALSAAPRPLGAARFPLVSRSVPAQCPISVLSFHCSILSFGPSVWLSRGTLHSRSAPARRPELPSLPFFRPFFLDLSCHWLSRSTLTPARRRTVPARRPTNLSIVPSFLYGLLFGCSAAPCSAARRPLWRSAPARGRSVPARRLMLASFPFLIRADSFSFFLPFFFASFPFYIYIFFFLI